MLRKKSDEKSVKLLQRAYALGYEVGYYQHYESVGWVKKELSKLREEAEKLGILDKLEQIYNLGKEEGKKKRFFAIAEKGELPTMERTVTHSEQRYPFSRIRLQIRTHHRPFFLATPKFLKRRNQF